MEIVRTDDFEKAFGKLPPNIKRLYKIQEDRFKLNWHDPRLHIKKIKLLPHALSFRITRHYRVFLYFQNPEKAIFFEVDHRKDAYKNLG